MTVGELNARMGSREFSEWLALHRMEPFPHERIEVMLAQVCASIYGAAGAKRVRAADFLPQWDRGRKSDWRQMKAQLSLFAQVRNQKLARSGGK